MTKVSSKAGPSGGEGGAAFPVGSWERPDAAGIVCRGDAADHVRGSVEGFGEPPTCWVGRSGSNIHCDRAATMEVYELAMCSDHGEEAASGALEEISYDLEQELQRPMNPHLRSLSPHLERALRHGFGSLPAEAGDHERADAALLEAFPLDREAACAETLAYVRDPDPSGRAKREPPHDYYMGDRLLVCRHMRLAFEEGATWLVELLEGEREQVAAQAAYALALEIEAGLRPRPGDETEGGGDA